MSRPPRPPFRDSPSGDQRGATATLDYVKLEFADLYRLALDAAKDDAGMALPGGGDDVTATLFELPSLIGHVLATYQDLYAGEAYISSAQSARSLVRHGRRLAYIPDGGLSATGYVVLTIKDGLGNGRIPEGFALSSTPAREQKAGTYETRRTSMSMPRGTPCCRSGRPCRPRSSSWTAAVRSGSQRRPRPGARRLCRAGGPEHRRPAPSHQHRGRERRSTSETLLTVRRRRPARHQHCLPADPAAAVSSCCVDFRRGRDPHVRLERRPSGSPGRTHRHAVVLAVPASPSATAMTAIRSRRHARQSLCSRPARRMRCSASST